MYRKHFGLEKRPFILTPDPSFLYMSKVHDLALTHLEYGIMQHAGFIALTGDVGAGKTTLLKHLLQKVKRDVDIAMIFNTNLDPHTLLDMLVREFELSPVSSSKADLFETLADHFIKQYSIGNRCVIVVDEAQNLPEDTFEELRMLSNLEVGNDFIVQIILVGQPQLRNRLSHPSLAQLAQRISVHFHLTPLSRAEIRDYIEHRLRVAGYRGEESLFKDGAIKYIAEISRGIPRIINSMCDACLTYAFADNLKRVSRDVVEKVIEDNELLQVVMGQETVVSDVLPVGPDTPVIGKADSDVKDMLIKVAGRVESIEHRLDCLETGRKDMVVEVLAEMLDRERKRNLSLEKRLVSLEKKMRILHDKLKTTNKEVENEDTGKRRNRYLQPIKDMFRKG